MHVYHVLQGDERQSCHRGSATVKKRKADLEAEISIERDDFLRIIGNATAKAYKSNGNLPATGPLTITPAPLRIAADKVARHAIAVTEPVAIPIIPRYACV